MEPKENVEKQTVFKEKTEVPAESDETEKVKTSSGLDENIAGLLCYLAWFITGVIFLVIEKENRFVRLHALQSIILSVILFILNIVLTAIPLIGWIIGLLLTPLYVVLWIFLMWKAYQGKWFKLPVVGNMAENQVDKILK